MLLDDEKLYHENYILKTLKIVPKIIFGPAQQLNRLILFFSPTLRS